MKRARKPRSKTEMDLEWEKLREEKREIAIKNKEIERRMADLNREKDKLKKQLERNEEREREKEIKSQERDAKLKRKEEMLDLKNKERELKLKLKEAQLQDKENERNRIEEEKNRKKDKVQAEQERFKNFFVSKPTPSKQQNTISTTDSRFVPFQVKDNMKLACLPSKHIDQEEFDTYLSLETQEFDSNTLLAEMKYRRQHNIHKQNQPMKLQSQNENDIIIVTEGGGDRLCRSTQLLTVRFKLLQFVENQRPAYFGTFFKRGILVTGRRPFGIDSTIMDYEVDSDLEWEPDDPDAESIKSNDSDEDVSGSQNDSNSEDGFFVPHGYLSEDEGHGSEENDEDFIEEEMMDPHASYEEKRKQKLKEKQDAWLSEISKKCQLLKPFIISRISTSQLSYENLDKINKCTAVLLVDDPLQAAPPAITAAFPSRPKGVPDMINATSLPYFTQYIHEENIGVDRAVMQFCIFWNEHYLPMKYSEAKPDDLTNLKVNKSRLTKTMHKIAKKIENKQWIVNEEFSCTNVLDINVKNEIRKLFPSKTFKVIEETDKGICSSPNIGNNNTAKTADKKDNTKFVGQIQLTKLVPQPQKQLNFYQTQNDTKIDTKSITSIKRKSLSELKSVVRIVQEIPISPPDVEMSEVKRVKLSTSNTSIESDIIILDTPVKEKGRVARRLALGMQGTDSKGTCIHVWK
ncbi:Chromatin assembly factor 1 subunit A [Oopsacas minuta]|uniref:Chromatin assembly factor 1 subunit A n=1 Tax=Oopsacas minuta TaxID=111878 RepID=A0AAV7JJZ2_9METZ|nr:Chromatin assembly factor 1 subunit A [Oopsacas minuta]